MLADILTTEAAMNFDIFDIVIGAGGGAILSVPAQRAATALRAPVKRHAHAMLHRIRLMEARRCRRAVLRHVSRKPDLIGTEGGRSSHLRHDDVDAEWQVRGTTWIRYAKAPSAVKMFGVTPLTRKDRFMSMDHRQTRYFSTFRQAAAHINEILSRAVAAEPNAGRRAISS